MTVGSKQPIPVETTEPRAVYGISSRARILCREGGMRHKVSMRSHMTSHDAAKSRRAIHHDYWSRRAQFLAKSFSRPAVRVTLLWPSDSQISRAFDSPRIANVQHAQENS
jgi:hypothetical protein